MTLVWSRVDCKLIHGQTAAAWAPHLKAEVIVIADDDTAGDGWAQKIMRLSLPAEVKEALFVAPGELAAMMPGLIETETRFFLIFKNLSEALKAADAGLELGLLNLGNQLERSGEAQEEMVRVGETFFARREELAALARWRARGLEVVVQSVPAAKPVPWKP